MQKAPRMARALAGALAAAALAGSAIQASADPVEGVDLVVNNEITLTTRAPAPAHLDGALPEVMSGWLFREDATRAMQMDDFDNPAMVFADMGRDLWGTTDGAEGKSCASCHGNIEEMRGVRAHMPRISPAGDDLWSMENFVNNCRTTRMGAEAWGWDSNEMMNMTAALSLQSRGLPVDVAIDGPAAPWWEKGREIYYTRFGQLELACSNCHQDHFGDMIRADHLSQGQINGFPVYRLKTAGLVSIHNRFKGCVRDTRAETFKPGSAEFRALELYVASRGQGLSVEGVSVRP
ncbi:sulfur oxidation c-type cytochrome SoxA [Phaeovulum vinaykumarii]|uniref:SoxAX cytochrome complex subunit A n=1 Tax=Phaeovulum vinaykumarii TaxID=407234 RepID=A0A1N7JJ63_9RHOB|nr:sulfur oxidation c-type cytochrome SoxA [Phaeovulum vinaykumarii]SIS49340.1 sulfur-oxidizing protein SoxA [Phaeovulum vinaykumarii]SOB89635.1 sulfur-oxidizing protein SoxA [Phaeovulum vinaykumarii]